MQSTHSKNIIQLFAEISQNIDASRIEELRKNFLRGVLGQKLLDPLPKCPVESMFWDWIFSYYPDNEASSVRYTVSIIILNRFSNFSREFLNFLLDHRRFVSVFLDWITQNEESLIYFTSNPGTHRIASFDIRLYADIFKRIIKEKLACVMKIF